MSLDPVITPAPAVSGQVSHNQSGATAPSASVNSQAPSLPAPTGSTPASLPAEAQQAPALAQALAEALSVQDSLAVVFAELAAVAASTTLPSALTERVQAVLAAHPPLGASATGADIQAAIANSGLFLEADLASSLSAPTGTQDLKASLIQLSALAQQILPTLTANQPAAASAPAPATQPVSPPGSPGLEGEAGAAGLSTAAAYIADALAADSAFTGTNPTSPPAQSQEPSPHDPSLPTPPLQNALIGQQASETAMASVISPLLAAQLVASESDLRDRRAAAAQPAQNPAAASSDKSGEALETAGQAPARGNARSPPPARGAPLRGQPAARSQIDPEGQPIEAVRRLNDAARSALARVTLLQLASSQGQEKSGSLRLELPLATPGGAAVAQFEIHRDGGGRTGREAETAHWRTRFHVQTAETGSVDGELLLGRNTLRVSLWLDQPEVYQSAASQTESLRSALASAMAGTGASVDVAVRIAQGKPEPAPSASTGETRPGQLIDKKT